MEAVAKHADFCRGRMTPAHGNFHGAQAVVPREIQQLGIEAKALDRLLLENDTATLAPEGFKAALSIYEGQPKNDANNLVENDACKFAERRFVDGDETAVHRAGSDGNVAVVSLQRVDEFVGFLDGRGKVGVGEKDKWTSRFLHTVTHAVTLAAVDSVRNDPQRRDSVAKRFRDRGGAIL